jgi:hypothetical protein
MRVTITCLSLVACLVGCTSVPDASHDAPLVELAALVKDARDPHARILISDAIGHARVDLGEMHVSGGSERMHEYLSYHVRLSEADAQALRRQHVPVSPIYELTIAFDGEIAFGVWIRIPRDLPGIDDAIARAPDLERDAVVVLYPGTGARRN